MKGMTQLPVGSFTLSDHLKLNVRASDDGTVLTIRERPSGKTTVAIVNEHGYVVSQHQRVAAVPAVTSSPQSSPTDPSPMVRINLVSVPLNMARPKPKRVRFTLRYTVRARPQNRPMALAAFSDGSVLHVLYRIQSGSHVHYDGQLRAEGDRVVIGKRVPEEEAVPKYGWNAFFTMPEETTFRIGTGSTVWRRLTAAEIEERVEEQVFVVSPVSSDPPADFSTLKRAHFKSKQISVLSCEAVKFDSADGEPAVAVAVERSGTIEPLVMTMNDARKLTAELLISLWTNDDEFAGGVLAAKFPCDDSGRFGWPKPT